MPIQDPIFDMPMDEVYNSPIAYDFSSQQSHAKVSGHVFIPGYIGNAMHIGDNGIAKTRNTTINLTQDFTVSVWIKNNTEVGYAAPQGIKFQFEINEASVSEFLHNTADIGTWVHWAFVKTSAGAKIYKNGVAIGTTPFGAGDLSAWAIRQILPTATGGFDYTLNMTFSEIIPAAGLADMDEVQIFDYALSDTEINQIVHPADEILLYWIDEQKFTDFGVYVEDSKGLIDALETKEVQTVDWAGEHGVVPDLERPRFMPREITLDCFFKSDGYMDFTLQMNEFLSKFKTKGTHRLRVDIDRRRPLVYEVYMESANEIKKKWRNSEFFGKFTLKLKEYLPVKRVLRFTKTNAQNTVTINIDCKTPFNIYWGDGTVTENVIGQQIVSHIYQENKVYRIICAGVLEDINAFTHNAILLWSNL